MSETGNWNWLIILFGFNICLFQKGVVGSIPNWRVSKANHLICIQLISSRWKYKKSQLKKRGIGWVLLNRWQITGGHLLSCVDNWNLQRFENKLNHFFVCFTGRWLNYSIRCSSWIIWALLLATVERRLQSTDKKAAQLESQSQFPSRFMYNNHLQESR